MAKHELYVLSYNGPSFHLLYRLRLHGQAVNRRHDIVLVCFHVHVYLLIHIVFLR